jgi:hypothetical protein
MLSTPVPGMDDLVPFMTAIWSKLIQLKHLVEE